MNRRVCNKAEVVCAYAVQALPSADIEAVEAHISACARCRRELDTLRPVLDWFVAWPTDVLRPGPAVQRHLAQRIAKERRGKPLVPRSSQWRGPQWQEVAPGLFCKLLAIDAERQRVSMLVRLLAGARYPTHTHADIEELYLLDGELWTDQRKLYPGDYQRAVAGTRDKCVWSETGCTCVLVTSTQDVLRGLQLTT